MNSTIATRKSEQGFTLVELAIVMIIIGLLIGGILKGQELIANAQVTSTVAQLKGLDAATTTFKDTFNALPGDMPNATNRLANCTACTATSGTQGNNQIESNPGDAVAAADEGGVFFRHLAAANLLTGVNATPANAAINVGDEVPAGSISGSSLRVGQVRAAVPTGNQGGAIGTWSTGAYLAVTGAPITAVGSGAGAEGATPSQAFRIDTKLDDGNPQTGSVRAGGQAACVLAGPPATYNTAVDQGNCAVFARIQG